MDTQDKLESLAPGARPASDLSPATQEPYPSVDPSNPYVFPPVLAEIVASDLPAATSPEPRPRLWTPFVVAIGGTAAAMLVASVILVIAMVADRGTGVSSSAEMERWMLDFGATPAGLLTMLVPAQATFLTCTLAAAMLSRQPWMQRLALVPSRRPWIYWPLFAAATPFIGAVTMTALQQVTEVRGSQLELINNILGQSQGPQLGLVLMLVAVIPGFVEELLFRGYVQSRLLQRLHPAVAIGVTSVLFALAHFDPVHSPAVMPLGIWLGVVAWRCGSIWPAVCCHVVNNSVAMFESQIAGSPGLSGAYAGWETSFVVGSGLALVLSVILLVRTPAGAPRPSATTFPPT